MSPMTPVQSSQIAAIGYDPTQKVLRVQFNNNSIYEYQNVEPETYSTVLQAESVGSKFNELIKKNKEKYPYQKV